MEKHATDFAPIYFETSPERYIHWKLAFDGHVATLSMDVQEDRGLRPGYPLKLNSYDLGVDIELADAIQRIRFEHPEVKVLVLRSAKDRIFCSGANIYMLGSSTHGFKVNFCKYTNETRIYLEDMAAESDVRTVATVNGICAGGGYELALACERILLVDDGNAAVSFPETPLLAVLPGTGGLTRVIDKRRVRRDLADVFGTMAEGIRGKRAEEWNLVDRAIPRSRFADEIQAEVKQSETRSERTSGFRLKLSPLEGKYQTTPGGPAITHHFVSLAIDARARTATIRMKGPASDEPVDIAAMQERGNDLWALRAFRELDDVLLHLRFNHPDVGVVLIKTEGDPEAVRRVDRALAEARDRDTFVREVFFHMKRVLRRLDITARSLFALIEPGSCFVGSLFELALSCDRSYMRNDADQPVVIGLSPINFAGLTTYSGLTRLQARFYGNPERVAELAEVDLLLDPEEAEERGLVTFAPDEIDWEDEVRIAIEERVSLSPDALTGMEANLRQPGPETMETKIFGRLSAWQNWIFTRPNATGEKGALSLYGRPARPEFDWNRT